MSIFAVFMSILFLLISIKMQYFENLDIPMTTLNEEKTKDNDDFTVVKRKS